MPQPTRHTAWVFLFILIAAIATMTAVAGDENFRQVTGPCGLAFPADHGVHPDYRTEWWYYTGNVTNDRGQRFGFQLTFFRSALLPPADRKHHPAPASAWRTDQIYLAHAAVSDIDNGRHLQAEGMTRGALSMAGAEQTSDATTIHLHSWKAAIEPAGHHISADTTAFSLDLNLAPAKPPVRHGDDGYSSKGPLPEQASCYYSVTRLEADGTLTVAGQNYRVNGSAWMDHEFSTAPLAPGIIGWDWFSLQLDDNTELMIYLLRQADGTMNPASSGTLVLPSGESRRLQLADMRVEALDHWTSPHSDARYPITWRVSIARFDLEIDVEANLADQEMHTPRSTGVTYWEGSVKTAGSRNGKTVSGVGYVELTGYAKPFDAPM